MYLYSSYLISYDSEYLVCVHCQVRHILERISLSTLLVTLFLYSNLFRSIVITQIILFKTSIIFIYVLFLQDCKIC